MHPLMPLSKMPVAPQPLCPRRRRLMPMSPDMVARRAVTTIVADECNRLM
jgi:hypothetical protein